MQHPPAPLSFAHRLWRALPTGPRRQAAARLSACLAPRPDRHPPPAAPGLAVGGELSRPNGLGEGARLMLAALGGAGVTGVGLDLGDPIRLGRRDLALPPAAMPLVLHVGSPWLPLALLQVPRALLRGRRVIGFWVWELPQMPSSWRVGLDFVHEIWTPSRFTAAALTALCPRRPIRVVPYPIAAVPPQPSPLGRAAFDLPSEAVITLVSFSLASSFARKNPLAAIAAHRAAFGNRADRLLLLKIGQAAAYPADMDRIRDAARGLDNVRILTADLATADRHALTACADIVLSLHRSEGFGLVPAEAMLLGVPVVATGWSGNAEFMQGDAAALVGYRLVPAIDPRGVFEAPGALWAEADIDDAVGQLRILADDPARRARLGAAGRAQAIACLGDGGLRAALAALR